MVLQDGCSMATSPQRAIDVDLQQPTYERLSATPSNHCLQIRLPANLHVAVLKKAEDLLLQHRHMLYIFLNGMHQPLGTKSVSPMPDKA